MSKKKIFRCQECGYETVIYEGRGFMGQHIEAMACPDCRNIVPLVVGGVIGDAAPSFNSLVGRLCLRCGSDRIHKWDMHTCPKCGGRMQPSGEEEFWTQYFKPVPEWLKNGDYEFEYNIIRLDQLCSGFSKEGVS